MDTDDKKKKIKKDKKDKNKKGNDEIADQIIQYMIKENRPYSQINLTDFLKLKGKKQIEMALENLIST